MALSMLRRLLASHHPRTRALLPLPQYDSRVRAISKAFAPLTDHGHQIEEETRKGYAPRNFYPVHIGEVFEGRDARYQVIGKLGYGIWSTTWLARDLKWGVFVTLKICSREATYPELAVQRETRAYERMESLWAYRLGLGNARLVRRVYEHFDIRNGKGGDGLSRCFVQEPMQYPITQLFRRREGDVELREEMTKQVTKHVLRGLKFLHEKAGIVHAGELLDGHVCGQKLTKSRFAAE